MASAADPNVYLGVLGMADPMSAGDGPDGNADQSADGQATGQADGHSGGALAWATWFWTTEYAWVMYVRDILKGVGVVLLVALILFAVSGVWPPMVAVTSGSMDPNLRVGDLVFVMEETRLAPSSAVGDTGIVTYRRGQQTGYTTFARPGDVIVYEPGGTTGSTQFIHRAMFWVEAGENWYDTADKSAVGTAANCQKLANCPAPHAGFITKGDSNARYDQVSRFCGGPCEPVKPAWIPGTAEFRIPTLGCIKLVTTGKAGMGCFLSVDVAHAGPLR